LIFNTWKIFTVCKILDLGFTNIIKPRVDALVGLSLLSEPDFRVAYTDTIKAVAEEKLEGVLSELKPKWVMTQNSNNAANNPTPKPAENGTF
jgi:hypothetical protein